MLIDIDKDLVKKRFSSCIDTYDGEAIIQRRIADHLFGEILKRGDFFNTIFEIGSGTGFLTKQVIGSLTFNRLFINDLVDQFFSLIDRCGKDISFIGGDMDRVDFPNSDLIISSSSIQWSTDLQLLIDRSFNALNSGGWFIVSTFGKDNFYEVSTLSKSSLSYFSIDELKGMMSRFSEVDIYDSKEVLYFDKPIDILKHQKLTGVNALKNSLITTPSLFKFLNSYEREFKSEKGIPLTYHPIYIMGRK